METCCAARPASSLSRSATPAAESSQVDVPRGLHRPTGHAEAVRIVFDPAKISYEEILAKCYFRGHDPTQLDRQNNESDAVPLQIFTTTARSSDREAIKARVDKSAVEEAGRDEDRTRDDVGARRGLSPGLSGQASRTATTTTTCARSCSSRGVMEQPLRLRASVPRLVWTAIGGPRQVAGKLRRSSRRPWLYASREIPRGSSGCARAATSARADARADRLRRARHAALRDRAGVARLLRAEGHLVRAPPAAAGARRSGVDDRSHGVSLGSRHDRRPRDAGRASQPGIRPAAARDVRRRPRRVRAPGPRDGRWHASAHETIAAIIEDRRTTRACSPTSSRYRRDPQAPPPCGEEQSLRADPVFARSPSGSSRRCPASLRYWHCASRGSPSRCAPVAHRAGVSVELADPR